MLRRLVLVLVAAAALLGAGCGDTVTAAIRVGDTTISDDELLDEVDEWASNELAVPQDLRAANDTLGEHAVLGDLVRPVARQRVQFELNRQAFDDLGLTIDAEARNQAVQVYFPDPQTADAVLNEFSDGYADRFLDDLSRELLVEATLGDAYLQWLEEQMRDVTIEVSSRYGRWNAESQQIDPPRSATTTTTATEAPIG